MQKITLLGSIGRDLEERTTKTGIKLVSFSLAVNPKKDQVVWYQCKIWENKMVLFKHLMPYLKKGSRVLVCGDLKTPETYEGKDGSIKIRLEVEPNFINFVGAPKKEDTDSSKSAGDLFDKENPF